MAEDTIPLLRIRRLSKTFEGVRVLSDVNLDVNAGTVHALLGQNGSGKSTLIKILSGYHAPDDDAHPYLELRGRRVTFPLASSAAGTQGMAFVHQDLALLPLGSITENVRLGRFRTKRCWRIVWRAEHDRTRRALQRLGMDLDPRLQVGDLSDVERAIVAIVRAVDQLSELKEGVLILDEPTAYLPRDAVGRLFRVIREAARVGFGVIFVTHRLEEAFAVSDRVAVLRGGRLVAEGATRSFDQDRLVEEIVGMPIADLYPSPAPAGTAIVLSVDDVSVRVAERVQFRLRAGEVLGMTGLMGMGWEEIPYALFGAAVVARGSVTLGSKTAHVARLTPRRAMELGLALLPANRLRDGAVSAASVAHNVSLPTLGRYWRGGRLRLRAERHHVAELNSRFGVKPQEPGILLGTLSGGNQQKALLAKWLERHPTVLLMHEPVQGVDVGARRQIFQAIRDEAQRGMSFLICSSEYADLSQVCDRVLVFRHGRVVSELTGPDLTEDRLAQESLAS